MRWNRNLAAVCALCAAVIGGVSLTVATGASEAATLPHVTMAIQEAVDGEGQAHAPGRRSGYHRGAERAAMAEQLGIEVETFRDAVRSANHAKFISDLAVELGISAGTLHELQQARQVEHLGDKLEWFLEARIIDDTQYAALQVELAQSDMEGFRKLMREYREASDFGDDGLRPRDGRGGPGHGPRHGGDSPDDKGISQ
jgi:hypothetical protein